jgi:hypothetical protein
MSNQENSIKDSVIKAISDGKISMRPRWQFVLRAVLLICGIMVLVLALLYLVSFAIFVLHETGEWFVPGFGPHGIREFLSSFPWVILLLSVAVLVSLEILVRKYSFSYKRPVVYTIFGIVILVMVGGVVVAQTPLHGGLYVRAHSNHLPIAGSLYRDFDRPNMGNVTVGRITVVEDDNLMILDHGGNTVTVKFSDDMNYPDGNKFKVGDTIVILGNRMDNTVTAEGIRYAPNIHVQNYVHHPLFQRVLPET